MASQSGTHLGPYEIFSAIGAGGMGEVYRARDPKPERRSGNKKLGRGVLSLRSRSLHQRTAMGEPG
jgi:serine/threonine protein kinase